MSAIAGPDIVCLILAQADNATLSQCLRVSKAWYNVAGPLLYRYVECSTTVALERLMIGSNVRAGTVSTRRSRVGTNLKKGLIGHVKKISASLEVCSSAVDRLRQFIELANYVEVRIQSEEQCYCDRIQWGKLDRQPNGPGCISAKGIPYVLLPVASLSDLPPNHGVHSFQESRGKLGFNRLAGVLRCRRLSKGRTACLHHGRHATSQRRQYLI